MRYFCCSSLCCLFVMSVKVIEWPSVHVLFLICLLIILVIAQVVSMTGFGYDCSRFWTLFTFYFLHILEVSR